MTDYEESIDSISMNGDSNSIIYDDITRQDLILQLKSKDKIILKLNSDIEDNKATISSLERQIADFVQRYGELKKNHDENYSSLQALLWVHCAQNHPDLSQIPPMEYESSQNSLIENDNRVGDHILGEILGEGTFAKVRSCRMVNRQDKDSNNKNYNLAIKIIDKSKIKTFTTLKRLSDEIGSLRRLSSSYIIGFHSVIHTTNYLYIITERGGKDMFEYLHMHPGVVNEDLAREIMLGILNGVNYIHEQGICHRDLKPENVLLTFHNSDMNSFEPGNVTVKLCDFGVCSKFRKKIMLLDFCGSPGFFAPEMITQGCYYGDKADIWSIGCILLELALGHRRFCLQWMKPYSYDVIQDAKLFSKKVNESIASLNDLLPVSNEYKDFVLDFLRIKASDRPQFKKISNHSWLKGMFHISSDGINADELSNLLNLYHNHGGDSNSLDNRKRLNSDSINLTPLGSVNQSFSVSNSTLLTTTQKLAAYIQSASPKSRQTPQNGSGRQSGDGTPFIHQRFMDMPLSDDLNNQLNALKNSLEDNFRQNLGYNEESVHRGTYNDRRPTYNDRRPTYNERRPTYSMARGTITSINGDEDAFNQSQLSDLRSQLLGLNQQSAPSARLFPTLSHQPSFLQQIPEKSEDNLQKTGSISSTINYSNDDNSSSMDIDQSTNEEVDTAPFRLPPTVNWKNLLPQNSIKSQSIESLESIDSNTNSTSIPVSNNTSNADYSRRRSFAPTHVIQKIVHVLLVEDSPFQRKLMARRLQSVGLVGEGSWEVVQCEDGESAIATVEACKDYKFDVIVVDQTLASDPSKLQGHEVVKHIRNKYPESIIIGCTANVSKHSSNLLLAGADLVWAKPLPREDVIFASIDSMMKMRRPQISGDVLNIRPAVVLSQQQQQEQMDEDG